MISEIDPELYLALKSGSVLLGGKRVIEELKSGEKPKLVIIASNIPQNIKMEVEYLAKISGVPLHQYSGKSIDMGRAFKKPFFVSAAAIMNEGESRILEVLGLE